MGTRRDFLATAGAATLLPFAAQAQTGDADAKFYALLDSLGESAFPPTPDGAAAARAKQVADVMALRGFDPTPLSLEARLDYDGIVEGLGLEAILRTRFPFGTVGQAISPYVVSPRSGTWLGVEEALKTRTADDVIAGIRGETARIAADATRRVVPPQSVIEATATRIAMVPQTIPRPVTDALDAQIAALNGLHERAPTGAGVWQLPDGGAYYALALKIGTSLDIDPVAAHQAGLALVQDLSARAEPLLRRQGLRKGAIGARLHALAQQPRFLYSDDDAGRAKAVADMNAQLARVRPRLSDAFTSVSSGAVDVQLAGPGKIGYRVAPSYDGSKPGAYYVDLRDIRRRPRWSLPTVVHHETLPGHLLQLPLQERAHPHPLRLRYCPNAFFEGWAIYAEQLAGEMQLLPDDVARLGFLQSLLVRAARLVVDTGIHGKRWTRAEAIARFAAIAGDAPDTFENEVDRIVVQPGATAGPALGYRMLTDLRGRIRARTTHSDKEFHAVVLKRGALRLSRLDWIVHQELSLPS
jgi:uncharacterized protein (DUF885 family)